MWLVFRHAMWRRASMKRRIRPGWIALWTRDGKNALPTSPCFIFVPPSVCGQWSNRWDMQNMIPLPSVHTGCLYIRNDKSSLVAYLYSFLFFSCLSSFRAQEARERERALRAQDEAVRTANEARNALENLLYSSRCEEGAGGRNREREREMVQTKQLEHSKTEALKRKK